MQQESAEKLAVLWTKAQSVVTAYVMSLVRDSHLTDDIVQQVAVVLVRDFDKYDKSLPFLPWALGIAKVIATRVRSLSAKEPICLLDLNVADQLQSAYEKELEMWEEIRATLHECLKKLNKRLLQVVHLHYSGQLKTEEISQQLNVSPGAVRLRLHRARTALRDCVQRTLHHKEGNE